MSSTTLASIFRGEAKGIENFNKEDLNREISATLSENQLDKRLLALTDPKAYQKAIKEEMEKAKKSAYDHYELVRKSYEDAGLTFDQSRALAIQSAKGVYQSYLDTVRLNYPEVASGLYAIGMKAEADRAAGSTGATPFSAMPAGDILRL